MSESEQEENRDKPGNTGTFDAAELEVLEKLASKVVKWGMSVPAILFLESSKPFNFLASQVLHFFNPFVSVFLDTHQYGTFASLLEKRESIEEFLRVIERKEAESKREDQESERN